MEFSLKCQLRPLVKYRQKQNKNTKKHARTHSHAQTHTYAHMSTYIHCSTCGAWLHYGHTSRLILCYLLNIRATIIYLFLKHQIHSL